MALRIGELPFFAQFLICLLVFIGVVAAGEYLAVSPVKQGMDREAELDRDVQQLKGVLEQLNVAKTKHADLQTQVKAFEDQLARTKEVVPEQKQTDEFIRMIQGAARDGRISVRRLTARSVVYKDFYAEIPFEVELDGAYESLLEFFRKLGARERIVNASGLKLEGADPAKPKKWELAGGTTVAGTCTVTTFYTPSAEEMAAAAPPKPGAKPGAAPAKK